MHCFGCIFYYHRKVRTSCWFIKFQFYNIYFESFFPFFFVISFIFYRLCHNFCYKLKKLNIYLIKSSKNTHIWVQFVAKILLWNFRYQSSLKSIKNSIETHKHTHTHTHTHPKQERLPVAETVKKVYQSHKYV